MRWDIFCKVIDNHGDAGVCWRLAAELARRGERVRLWIDQPDALDWMAPFGQVGVEVVHWHPLSIAGEPADVVVETFGCDPPSGYVAVLAERQRGGGACAWINLEYLSAEADAERSHGLPSPMLHGPGKGLVKRFFYPGFTERTGGLIRERELPERQAAFDRTAWLRARGIDWQGETLLSLFCYEPPALSALLEQLATRQPTLLLVAAGRAQAAVAAASAALPATSRLRIHALPLLSQHDFDHLLWACDLNFVRGEDSLVRALWAAKPLIWQAYPQDDGAHHSKLLAFLNWLQPPPSQRALHLAWNGLDGIAPALLTADATQSWQPGAQRARQRLLVQDGLVEQLIAMARRERGENR